MAFDLSVILDYWPVMIRGLGVTVALFVISLVLSLVLGTMVALARLSRVRVLLWMATGFIELVRNIPFMIQVFLLFYVLPFYGLHLPAFVVGVIVLTVFGGAYYGEIVRAAILSVPKGQLESARATGMSKLQAMRHVVFPQMVGFFIPPATNQAVMLIKETSVLSTITIVEMTMAAQIVQGYTYSPIEVFFMISILYWILCSGLSRSAGWLEVALQPFRHRGSGPRMLTSPAVETPPSRVTP